MTSCKVVSEADLVMWENNMHQNRTDDASEQDYLEQGQRLQQRQMVIGQSRFGQRASYGLGTVSVCGLN